MVVVESYKISFLVVQLMDWKVDELDNLCKVVAVLRSHDAIPDHPVHDHGGAGRLELVSADEIRNVRYRHQSPLRHLAVIIGGAEGLGKLEIKDILRVRADSAARGPVEEGNRPGRPQLVTEVTRNIGLFPGLLSSGLS